MMNKTANINFYLKHQKGNSPIFVNVAINNIRVKKNIQKITVNATFWDKNKQRLKPGFPDKDELQRVNSKLVELEASLSAKFDKYNLTIQSQSQLQDIVNAVMYGTALPSIKENEIIDFFDYYKRYLAIAKNEVSYSFIKAQSSTMNKLVKFEEYLGKKLTFELFDINLFDELYSFLLSCKKGAAYSGGPHNNSTINGQIKRIKIFLSFAKNRKWHNSADFKDYKRKRQAAEDEAPVIALKWNEFIKLHELTIENKLLSQIKDVFAFSCVTGLRYSDYSVLTKKEFKLVTATDSAGNDRRLMETFIIKNRRRVAIRLPFSDYAMEIIEKYADTPTPYLLPHYPDTALNKGIKKIVQMLDLDEYITSIYYSGGEQIKSINKKWQLITTHSGRKTFISKNVEEGVPLHVVASFTGHSKNSKALARYYEISDKMKVDYIPMSLYKIKTEEDIDKVPA